MAAIFKKHVIMLCINLSLCACSTAKVQQDTIPEQGLTLSQLYKHTKASPLPKKKAAHIGLPKPSPQFKALPNPEIPIYIFAHVAHINDEQIIKPAYTTRFFLYKQNQYALASELY